MEGLGEVLLNHPPPLKKRGESLRGGQNKYNQSWFNCITLAQTELNGAEKDCGYLSICRQRRIYPLG